MIVTVMVMVMDNLEKTPFAEAQHIKTQPFADLIYLNFNTLQAKYISTQSFVGSSEDGHADGQRDCTF